MKVVALVMLGILALLGGLALTKKLKEWYYAAMVTAVSAQAEPCTCGCEEIKFLHGFTPNGDVWVIVCPECGRFLMEKKLGRKAAERWNDGERDGTWNHYLKKKQMDARK